MGVPASRSMNNANRSPDISVRLRRTPSRFMKARSPCALDLPSPKARCIRPSPPGTAPGTRLHAFSIVLQKPNAEVQEHGSSLLGGCLGEFQPAVFQRGPLGLHRPQ